MRRVKRGADGVVSLAETFRRSDHPVRSFQSRPPLLCEEGNAHQTRTRFAGSKYIFAFDTTESAVYHGSRFRTV